jgi:hypothetical protein
MDPLLQNAITSIQMGVEDFQTGRDERMLSAARNLYSGILLLFKEKLRELSPPDSDEILLRVKFEPTLAADGSVKIQGVGKRTIDYDEIKDRFKQLGIYADWVRLGQVKNIRNQLEHYYTNTPPKAVGEAIANTFVVVRKFIREELDEDPQALLGRDCCQVMLAQNEFFETELAECREALSSYDWDYPAQRNFVEDMRCHQCKSPLVRPTGDYSFSCSSCGFTMGMQELVVSCMEEHFSYITWRVYKDGGEPPIVECPSCNLNGYSIADDACLICQYTRGYRNCDRCGNNLEIWEQELDGYCSWCTHQMEKLEREDD